MDEYRGKRLLILGGAVQMLKVVEAAKALGVYTIVADRNPNGAGAKFADEFIPYSVMDPEGIISWCEEHPVDGVLNFCIDYAQKAHQKVCEHFGFPCFGTALQYLTLTDKTVFKAYCREHDVDVIPEFDPLGETFDFPVLVKPAESSGSRGAVICHTVEEVHDAYAEAKEESRNGKVICEKYMADCQDFTISYYIRNGVPTLVSLGDRYPGRAEDGLSRQLSGTIQPSAHIETFLKKPDKKIRAMLESLGMQNALCFFQGFLDGDTVRLYDPAIRFPGNEYERIVRAATGIDFMEGLVKYALGDGMPDYEGRLNGSWNLDGKCAIQYMVNVRPGSITTIKGLDEIAALPFTVDVAQKHFLGDVIRQTGDINHRFAELSLMTGRDPEEAAAAIRKVQSLLEVLDENGESMLISAFPPERMLKNYSLESWKK